MIHGLTTYSHTDTLNSEGAQSANRTGKYISKMSKPISILDYSTIKNRIFSATAGDIFHGNTGLDKFKVGTVEYFLT